MAHWAMRLDLGAGGKIIGTRRVSPNGQVSGLSEYAGQEVLVILPGGPDSGLPPPWSNLEDVTRAVNDQIRQAYDRYRVLQETYPTPWEATRSFLEGLYGSRAPDLMAEVDRWVRSQVHPEGAGSSSDPEGSPGATAAGQDGNPSRAARTKKGATGGQRP